MVSQVYNENHQSQIYIYIQSFKILNQQKSDYHKLNYFAESLVPVRWSSLHSVSVGEVLFAIYTQCFGGMSSVGGH